ncbi:4354_t:CDS:2 [Cetraspora pellucida]|uniref:4354_t:CDS:1 n=1 Tax=Cetraspora pellucida TaxID=1433469 RepID=A0A9N9HPC8_9GLOM|nr:4354_t:CDS:2 [Cetraspora pellucida]
MGICNSKSKPNKSVPDKSRFEDSIKHHDIENNMYYLPNDIDESDRLQILHFVERYIWQSNFFAPINHLLNQEGAMVLDVGTGRGSWLLEMATKYPNAKFIGMDISPVQLNVSKPKNAEFIEANILEHLPFADNTFDYVFQRFLNVGILTKSWPSVISELVRILKPGGYIELMEGEILFNNMGPATTRLMNGMIIIFDESGLDSMACHKIHGYLEEHKHLHNVHYEIKKHMDFECGEKFYKMKYQIYANGLVAVKPKLINIIEASSDEYDELLKKMCDEMIENESFGLRVRVYAQKLDTSNTNVKSC